MKNRPINRDNLPKAGDVLIPKRGRYLDPVIVLSVNKPDRQIVVKDKSLVERDPIWAEGNKCVDATPASGALRLPIREIAKDYLIDAEARKALNEACRKWMEDRGWSRPESWDD